MKKKIITLLMVLFVLSSAVFAQSIYELKDGQKMPMEGLKTNGFTVEEISDFDMIGATVYRFEHDKTGATVLYVANEDTNRTFIIGFRTPTETDSGIPHVFEHATTDGSEKYLLSLRPQPQQNCWSPSHSSTAHQQRSHQ